MSSALGGGEVTRAPDVSLNGAVPEAEIVLASAAASWMGSAGTAQGGRASASAPAAAPAQGGRGLAAASARGGLRSASAHGGRPSASAQGGQRRAARLALGVLLSAAPGSVGGAAARRFAW